MTIINILCNCFTFEKSRVLIEIHTSYLLLQLIVKVYKLIITLEIGGRGGGW